MAPLVICYYFVSWQELPRIQIFFPASLSFNEGRRAAMRVLSSSLLRLVSCSTKLWISSTFSGSTCSSPIWFSITEECSPSAASSLFLVLLLQHPIMAANTSSHSSDSVMTDTPIQIPNCPPISEMSWVGVYKGLSSVLKILLSKTNTFTRTKSDRTFFLSFFQYLL